MTKRKKKDEHQVVVEVPEDVESVLVVWPNGETDEIEAPADDDDE